MSRGFLVRTFALAATALGFASTASAYYYYVHYSSRSAPYAPMYEKYDVNAVPNKTVLFYISDSGPSPIPSGDSFQAVISEIRSAADVWNQVSTSDLRIAYGGLYTSGSGQINSGITVDFSDDIPPGLYAISAPDIVGPVTFGPNGPFLPIVRSRVHIRRDLLTQMPSWSELFFTTLVHEFGHSIGLQHTLTSSVMSTAVTSASSKAAPLSQDDISGISALYPTGTFLTDMGSISGRVTMNGSGVGMASVVALSPSNPAISTITNPDGTYRINGVPPGLYTMYVHPLPAPLQGESSPANMVPPKDPNGNSLPFPTTAFDTQFYGGTRDYTQSPSVYVYSGTVTSGTNFSVRPRNYVGINSIRTYGYSAANVPIASPPLGLSSFNSMVAAGPGLLLNGSTVAPGLNISVLGNAVAQFADLRPYSAGGYNYLAMDVTLNGNFGYTGPKHLVFTTANDLYILPSGFTIVSGAPPSISSVTPGFDNSGNRIATISGSNFQKGTRILFDGLSVAVSSVSDDGTTLTVVPPPGPGSYQAVLTALNSDGQSSNFLQASAPAQYFYDSASQPSIAVPPGVLAPGDDVVDVIGTNTNFIDGQVWVGFGSSDAVVKKVTVVSPTHLRVNVTVGANAFVPATAINVTNGLNVISQNLGALVQTSQ